MTAPRLALWTFDGPPDDSDSLTPPSYDRPKNLGSTTSSEGILRYSTTERDDDEFYDAPATPDDPIWTRYDKGKGKALPSGPSTPPATPPKSAAQKILRGEHHVATFRGTSQYSRGGSSTCGLASLNAIRLAFDLYEKIMNGEELVAKLVSEKFVEDVMAIAASWSDRAHLEVEPILELPMFSNAFQVLDIQYRELRYRTFSDLLLSLKPEKGSSGPRAACLTRAPEIIAIVYMPITGLDNNSIWPTYRRRVDSIYLIFDSHPRPGHPNGAGIQVFASDPTEDVADYLMDLFQFDEKLVNDPHLEWQAQLLGQVSYHVLAPAKSRDTPNEYELNMRFLALHQKFAETKQKLDDEQAQKRELQRRYFALEQEVGLLNRGNQRMRNEIEELKTALKRASPRESNTHDNSWGWRDDFTNRNVKGKGRDHGHDPPSNLSWRADRGGSSESEFSSWQKAPDWPRALPAIPSRPSGSRLSGSKPSGSQPSGSQSRVVPAASRRYAAEPSSSETSSSNAQDVDTMKSLKLAMAMQRQFDQEREAFALDVSLAQALERPKFDCSICTDSFTDEDIAIVDGCNHSCCRGCMRDLIQSQIQQRRYPIPCPFCAVNSDTSNPPGPRRTIQAWLVETIGISAELFDIFVEMQLAEHSVQVNCRKCSGSAFIDRRDYDSIKVVACPVAGCTHSWCKQCNQTIEDQVKHSCDGSAELESLMGQRGWKHCPGCRTPIERTSGCNSMTCKTPGCNMNFCYQCGGARGGRAGNGVPRCSC